MAAAPLPPSSLCETLVLDVIMRKQLYNVSFCCLPVRRHIFFVFSAKETMTATTLFVSRQCRRMLDRVLSYHIVVVSSSTCIIQQVFFLTDVYSD